MDDFKPEDDMKADRNDRRAGRSRQSSERDADPQINFDDVDLDADDVEHIEQHMAKSLKRPGQAIAFQPLQFLLSPRFRLGLGFAIAVQCSLFAVSGK